MCVDRHHCFVHFAFGIVLFRRMYNCTSILQENVIVQHLCNATLEPVIIVCYS